MSSSVTLSEAVQDSWFLISLEGSAAHLIETIVWAPPAHTARNMVAGDDKPVAPRFVKPVWLVWRTSLWLHPHVRCFPDRLYTGSSANAFTPS